MFFSNQTSVRPFSSLEQLPHNDCGYLMPNPGQDPATTNDGYLMPDANPPLSTATATTASVTMAVDNDGYLLATSPLPNGKLDEKTFEQWPMLRNKDNGNFIPV